MVKGHQGRAFSGDSPLSEFLLKLQHFPKSRWFTENKSRVLCFLGTFVITCALYGYWKIVTDFGHGTFLPPFVQMSTSHFGAKVPSSSPPKGWLKESGGRAPFRVVLSMTTMPHHLKWMQETVDSLFAQSYVPNAIYLNIPRGEARTGDVYYIPKYLNESHSAFRYKKKIADSSHYLSQKSAVANSQTGIKKGGNSQKREKMEVDTEDSFEVVDFDYRKKHAKDALDKDNKEGNGKEESSSNSILQIIRSKDYGPLTKLAPALLVERDSDTLVITVDDDQVYDPSMVEHLLWHSMHAPDNAWGDCGWGFLRVPHKMVVTRVYVPFMFRSVGGRRVQVIEGICGNAFRRGFFPDFKQLTEMQPEECGTTDDLWVAGYLQFIRGWMASKGKDNDSDAEVDIGPIPRVLMSANVAPHKTKWKVEKEDWSKTLYTVNINTVDKRIKCIRAIERLFKVVWVE